jgi:hypothetical protein
MMHRWMTHQLSPSGGRAQNWIAVNARATHKHHGLADRQFVSDRVRIRSGST